MSTYHTPIPMSATEIAALSEAFARWTSTLTEHECRALIMMLEPVLIGFEIEGDGAA